jgi:MioC protein
VSRTITLLVGTMTGTAELVAEEIVQTLADAGYAPRMELMDQLQPSIFAEGEVFLVVSSTYGNGDVPDNAQAFFASLAADRPDLSHVVYGVVALGDMTYKATFCNGGLQFDHLLTELGARRAGEPLKHDASCGTLPEDIACTWAKTWAEQQLAPALAA